MKRFLASFLSLLICSLALAQTHSVALAWDASTSSFTTNPGSYSVYRAPANADGSCPTSLTKITSGLTVLTYTDLAVTAGATYCYAVSFVYTQPGQPLSSESDLSSPPLVVTIPNTTPPPTKPSAPTNLRLVTVQ